MRGGVFSKEDGPQHTLTKHSLQMERLLGLYSTPGHMLILI